MKFDPIIIGFCCSSCSYSAADLSGSSGLKYPSNVRIIRMPCSGKVDVLHILRAFEMGADGVFVAGCMEGRCRYLDGNIYAEKRVKTLKEKLDKIGFSGERLDMFFLESAGKTFSEVVTEFTEKIKKLGPNPLK